MQVRIISDHNLWDTFITQQPNGHLLQSFAWGELTNTLGNTIIRLGAFDGERLVGTMMLSVTQVPMPHALSWINLKWLYCCRGPIVEEGNTEALVALLQEAHAFARREQAVMLRLEPNISAEEDAASGLSDMLQESGFMLNPYAVHPRRSWVLDLQPEMDKLFKGFHKKWRQNVRQAERRGVSIRQGRSEADFDAFYKLLYHTSVQQNFFIHPRAYYKRIFKIFIESGQGALLIAEHEQRIVGVNMVITYGQRCWDMYSGSVDKRLGLNESYLLQYACFAWAKEHGCTHFDFRAIPEVLEPGEEMYGIYEFKKGFGGYSVLNMPTHDFVYRPLLYKLWAYAVKRKREGRKEIHERNCGK